MAGQKALASPGRFLVAAYRRPDFRVDANLAGESSLAGARLKGVVTGRYLFGAADGRPRRRWTYTRAPLAYGARVVTDAFPLDRYVFLDGSATTAATGSAGDGARARGQARRAGADRARPRHRPHGAACRTSTRSKARSPTSRGSTIAGRASFRVDPAPVVRRLAASAYFADVNDGRGHRSRGRRTCRHARARTSRSTVDLTQVQWHRVRRAEGSGFYTWETERKEIEAGRWHGRRPAAEPVPLARARSRRAATSSCARRRRTRRAARRRRATSFYVLGSGYTAWERYDHNRIDLVPEKKTYRPGERRGIMIKSPWEKAHRARSPPSAKASARTARSR